MLQHMQYREILSYILYLDMFCYYGQQLQQLQQLQWHPCPPSQVLPESATALNQRSLMPWLGLFAFRCPTKERTRERAPSSQACERVCHGVRLYYAHTANVSEGPPHTTCWCHFFGFTSSFSCSSSSSVQHRGMFQLRPQFISSEADHQSVLLSES